MPDSLTPDPADETVFVETIFTAQADTVQTADDTTGGDGIVPTEDDNNPPSNGGDGIVPTEDDETDPNTPPTTQPAP